MRLRLFCLKLELEDKLLVCNKYYLLQSLLSCVKICTSRKSKHYQKKSNSIESRKNFTAKSQKKQIEKQGG